MWAPVEARQLYDDVYRILPQPLAPEDQWQFTPGDTVRCESVDSDSGLIMVAVAPA